MWQGISPQTVEYNHHGPLPDCHEFNPTQSARSIRRAQLDVKIKFLIPSVRLFTDMNLHTAWNIRDTQKALQRGSVFYILYIYIFMFHLM